MKNKKLTGLLVAGMSLALAIPFPTFADASKVVTLGADLTEEQRTRMLNYFKVDPNTVRIITITNQDERDHLSSYVPLEQIGTFTVSSAYVNPTMSGGIKVRTANLNWVTSNRIAATLSTSGVVNCEVIAAAPFEVSGTGALTGVIMAYEEASGEKLDETKKELAAQEMVVTGDLAGEIGSMEATAVVNEAKMEVIGENIQVAEEIQNVVNNIVEENNYQISDEKLDEVIHLLEEIANQDYNYEDMKETLERVEENVSDKDDMEMTEPPTGEDENMVIVDEPEATEGGILDDLDETVLGENVIASSTEEPEWENPSLPENEEWDYIEEQPGEEENYIEEQPGEEWDYIEEQPEEEWDYEESWETLPEDNSEETETVEDWDMEEISEDVDMDGMEDAGEMEEGFDQAEDLDDAQRTLYEKAELFCNAAFQNDMDAYTRLQELGELDGTEEFSPSWGEETGTGLTEEVLQAYLNVLLVEGSTYENQEDDIYYSEELNLMKKELERIFGLSYESYEGVLSQSGISNEECSRFYTETLHFFEKLYQEESTLNDEADTEEAAYEETYEGAVEETGDQPEETENTDDLEVMEE